MHQNAQILDFEANTLFNTKIKSEVRALRYLGKGERGVIANELRVELRFRKVCICLYDLKVKSIKKIYSKNF